MGNSKYYIKNITVSFSIIIGLVVYSKDKFESNAMICSKNHLNRAIVFFIRLSFFFENLCHIGFFLILKVRRNWVRICLRRYYNFLVQHCENSLLRRLGNVPPSCHWEFCLRLVRDALEMCQWYFFVIYSWDIATMFFNDVVEMHHWDISPMFHQDVFECFCNIIKMNKMKAPLFYHNVLMLGGI